MGNTAEAEETQDKQCMTVDLHYIGEGSDKTYHLAIVPGGDGLFDVLYANGRRGQRLTRDKKTKGGPVPYDKAKKIYAAELKGKLAKGYKYAQGIAGQVFDIPASPDAPQAQPWTPPEKKKTGIMPQQLARKTEDDAEHYITHPDFCEQQKYDGNRIIIESNGSAKLQGTNKKGIATDISPTVARNVLAIGLPLTIDAEIIGETLYVFGLLEVDGVDYKRRPYREVMAKLEEIFANHDGNGIRLAKTAYTEEEKRALYNKLKAEEKEGVVFKSLSSPYSEKRVPSQVKVKFYEEASFLVMGVNDKSSVKVGLHLAENDATSELVCVGNVTIPQGKPIPPERSVIDVRYLYAYRGGSIFQATYLRPRHELDPEDCWMGQLKYKPDEEDE